MLAFNIHTIALNIHMIALNIHTVALNIHTVALNIYTVALNIHTVALNILPVALNIRVELCGEGFGHVSLSARIASLRSRRNSQASHTSHTPTGRGSIDLEGIVVVSDHDASPARLETRKLSVGAVSTERKSRLSSNSGQDYRPFRLSSVGQAVDQKPVDDADVQRSSSPSNSPFRTTTLQEALALKCLTSTSLTSSGGCKDGEDGDAYLANGVPK
eukprot:1194334-Prorocentrum_minimum.AAC.4